MQNGRGSYGSESDVQAWQNTGSEIPDWVRAVMDGPPNDNGTFLIRTPLGRQRVHRDYLVVSQAGHVYTCPRNEADERVRAVWDIQQIGSRPTSLVGPGKSLKTAIPKRPEKRTGQPAQRRRYSPIRSPQPSIEWVLIEELLVDESYQRSIDNHTSQRLIATIASRWDWRLCMPLAVSRRPEGKFVIDGQHRLAAARLRGDLFQLPCCIATYDGPSHEAAMFVAANRCRRAISRLDDFHAAVVAGDEDALEVKRIVDQAGLQIARKTGSGSLGPKDVLFTSSILRVMSKDGEGVASTALRMIAGAFPEQALTNGGALFVALSQLLTGKHGRIEKAAIDNTLKSRTMAEWSEVVRGANGGDTRALLLATAIREACRNPVGMHKPMPINN